MSLRHLMLAVYNTFVYALDNWPFLHRSLDICFLGTSVLLCPRLPNAERIRGHMSRTVCKMGLVQLNFEDASQ